MSEERLNRLIEDFSHRNLNLFFRGKCENYAETREDLSQYDDERFSDFQKLGEIRFDDGDRLVVTTSRVTGDLSERSGKKAQYEKAKKILKELAVYDAGFFIFHDGSGSFRFSLVYGQAEGTRKSWSNFRRFTYFVSKDLTNKTFRIRVGGCTFISLQAVKDAFSVEKVNKEFYGEIAKYYYRLTGKNGYKKELALPSVGEDDGRKHEEFAVRLIGRVIFCWFLRHKKSAGGNPLIPREALSVSAAQNHSDYYHSILEPLFFEVMNKPVKERKPVNVPQSDMIPFLNGGLFEPHVNDYYQNSPNYALKIPDNWFVDFFSVLEQYNFTIDENSTVDADVSVDPEMLGRIFENLLAEVVPETGETARKATGSYYTPRIIVDYMVEQSLKQYLLTRTGLPDEKLDSLLSYEDIPVDLSDTERSDIVTALKEIKVIDPACGSGAFPMGILHRMLLLLEKVDPSLETWKRLYLSTYHPVMRKIIEDKLRKGNEQYIRKLTVIQDSIYGVDIQPIAVEIAKLRCFLSLVVDEIVLDNEENRGIEPLPNLEFKFVAANTLIGLPEAANQSAFGVTATVDKLKELRESYLRSFGAEKLQIEKEFRATQRKLFKENVQWAVADTLVKQLTEWDPFSYESCGWFDPGWMFGESGGFDVVIANPPYGAELKNHERSYLENKYSKFKSAVKNSAIYFSYRAQELLDPQGIHTYIVPKSLCYSQGWNKCAAFISKGLIKLIDTGKAFEEVLLEQVIYVRTLGYNSSTYRSGLYDGDIIKEFADVSKDIFDKYCILLTGQTPEEMQLIKRIITNFATKRWGDYVSIERGLNWQSKSTRKQKGVPIHRGAQLSPYHLAPATDYVVLRNFNRVEYEYQLKPKILNQLAPAHVMNPYPHFKLQAALDLGSRLVFETISCTFPKTHGIDIKFLLGINNSKLFAWLLYKFVYSNAIRSTRYDGQYIGKIPCPELEKSPQTSIVTVVDQILNITKDEDYLSSRAKQDKVKEYQRQVDRMVYELYRLTEEEIAVVEGTFNKK